MQKVSFCKLFILCEIHIDIFKNLHLQSDVQPTLIRNNHNIIACYFSNKYTKRMNMAAIILLYMI